MKIKIGKFEDRYTQEENLILEIQEKIMSIEQPLATLDDLLTGIRDLTEELLLKVDNMPETVKLTEDLNEVVQKLISSFLEFDNNKDKANELIKDIKQSYYKEK